MKFSIDNIKTFLIRNWKYLTAAVAFILIVIILVALSNKENVLFELDTCINSLLAYKEALMQEDSEALIALLDEGRKRKEEVDG